MSFAEIPAAFGRYEILLDENGLPRILGQGGMGRTLLAKDPNLDALVVVKTILPALLSKPKIVERFLLEARAIAKLRHDHIVRIHNSGSQDGIPYYIMEYLPGQNLSQEIKARGPLSIEESRQYILELAEALDAVHGAQMVHRDIKPSNVILLLDRKGEKFVCLVDFGVVSYVHPNAANDSGEKGIVGTPHYASPEQLMGSQEPDIRSDLYSLGCVWWTCLTGKTLFQGTREEVIRKQIECSPDMSKLPMDMPLADRELIACLLHKKQDGRPESPEAFLRMMGRHPQASSKHSAEVSGNPSQIPHEDHSEKITDLETLTLPDGGASTPAG